MIRFALGLVVLLMLAVSAFSGGKSSARDANAINTCIREKTASGWAWEQCIGVVSELCSKDEMSSSSAVIDCYRREQAVWDAILNESYLTLRRSLDDNQVGKLRDMQRAWIASRDRSCAFLTDYFQGSMANPMAAACVARETARRALYLLGLADDVTERKMKGSD